MLQEKYLTVAEAAERLGVNHSRVCQLLRAGRLKGQKIGRLMWLIREEDLEKFAAEERKPGRPRKNNGTN